MAVGKGHLAYGSVSGLIGLARDFSSVHGNGAVFLCIG